MKPSDFQKTIQCQFDCKLKKVVKGIVRNYRKGISQTTGKEVSFVSFQRLLLKIDCLGRLRK